MNGKLIWDKLKKNKDISKSLEGCEFKTRDSTFLISTPTKFQKEQLKKQDKDILNFIKKESEAMKLKVLTKQEAKEETRQNNIKDDNQLLNIDLDKLIKRRLRIKEDIKKNPNNTEDREDTLWFLEKIALLSIYPPFLKDIKECRREIKKFRLECSNCGNKIRPFPKLPFEYPAKEKEMQVFKDIKMTLLMTHSWSWYINKLQNISNKYYLPTEFFWQAGYSGIKESRDKLEEELNVQKELAQEQNIKDLNEYLMNIIGYTSLEEGIEFYILPSNQTNAGEYFYGDTEGWSVLENILLFNNPMVGPTKEEYFINKNHGDLKIRLKDNNPVYIRGVFSIFSSKNEMKRIIEEWYPAISKKREEIFDIPHKKKACLQDLKKKIIISQMWIQNSGLSETEKEAKIVNQLKDKGYKNPKTLEGIKKAVEDARKYWPNKKPSFKIKNKYDHLLDQIK